MSSNHPYGGPQPPMPGPGANPGPGPGSRCHHRTDTRSSLRPAGRLQPLATPLDPSPLTSRPRTGKVTPGWSVRASPGPYGRGPARRAATQGQGQDLDHCRGASLAVILMAVFAVVVAMRGRANPGGSAQGQQTNPAQSSAHSTPAFGCGLGIPAGSCCRRRSRCLVLRSRSSAHRGSVDQRGTRRIPDRAALTEIKCRLSKIKMRRRFLRPTRSATLLSASPSTSSRWRTPGAQPCRQGPRSRLHCGRIGSGQDQRGEGGPGLGRGAAWLVRLHHRAAVCRLRVQECCAGEESVRRGRHLRIQSQLTKSGKKAVISVTEKSFNKCLKAHSLNPKNCPMKFDSKYRYTKSTITWRQTRVTPSGNPITLDGTQARIEIPLNLKLSGSCTYQGRSGNCSGTLTGRSVAVVKVTTKPLKVDWL